MSLGEPPAWNAPSTDPNDQQFGDVVEPTTLTGAAAYDAVLLGEPYDGAVIGRRGASEGPGAIRESFAGVKTHHFGVGPVGAVGDVGDVRIPEGSTSEVQAAVAEVAAAVHRTEAFPVFLGGDNSLSYANVRPLLDRPTVVVSLDAHLDCRAVEDEPTSGTPYRQLYEAGLESLCVVGARHFETSTAYDEYLHSNGGTALTAERVSRNVDGAVERIGEAVGDAERLYLSLDLDVLDAAAAPGVSAPTPGGLTTTECFRLLHRLARDDRVVGFEVVECAPRLDRDGLTVDAAARAVAHVLAGRQAVVA